VIAALKHEEADRIPTGENSVDGKLAQEILGAPLLYNMGWQELQAIWNGRRDEVVRDTCRVHVELPKTLEWDYVRVPVVPAAKDYSPPKMTGENSWINEQGYEVHFNPDAGNIITRSDFPDMSVDDLPDPEKEIIVDDSELEAIRHTVRELGDAKQCEVIHELGGYFIKHTDGNLWEVLDDLVEIGIDGWHGIQRNIGMDMAKLKKRYGGRLCLFGGVNAETLIAGTPEIAREEVRTAIARAGKGGGLVLTCSNVVAAGASLEIYRAMRQAISDYGTYPLG